MALRPIYPEIASKYGALLYPFFLDGVAGDAKLNQRDGLHPTAAGVDQIVAGILPKAEELIARVRRRRVLRGGVGVLQSAQSATNLEAGYSAEPASDTLMT